jgi:hypothetical protein
MVSGTRFLEKTFMKDTDDGEFLVKSIKLISLDIWQVISSSPLSNMKEDSKNLVHGTMRNTIKRIC